MRPFFTVVALLSLLALPAVASAEPRRHTVSMEDLRYKPAEIRIRVGDTVVWVNNDDREHTVSADDGSFRSGRMGSGRRFEHTFDKAGTYTYHDDVYGRMSGAVVVRGGGE